MTPAAATERIVAVTDLRERLGRLRLLDASALSAMGASLKQHGQLSAVQVFEQGDVVEVFDGFKRLRAARTLGLRSLRAVVADVDVVEATVQMRELHAGRGLTALEEGWIVRALHRDHGVSQGAIAARMRCHKSWICRRLMLVEALDTSLQADVRLGLLSTRAAVLLSALPRGNQSAAAGAVIGRGLTVRQTVVLVRELVDAPGPEEAAAVLARWSSGRPPARPSASAPRSALETIAVDVATIRRRAGRLQACLAARPLPATDPGAAALLEPLAELVGVLGALRETITGTLRQRETR
jgi:ParB/RepB/Spo0J family partition protein